MACGPNCPCQCVRTKKKRRSHKVLAPRHNPVYDLLSFLVAEKYKEPINKPTIAKPQGIAVGTSTEPSITPSIETKVEQALEKVEPIAVHEGVQTAEMGTQYEPVKRIYSRRRDKTNEPKREEADLTESERATAEQPVARGGGGGFSDTSIPEPVKKTYVRLERKGLNKPSSESPLGNVVAALQAQTDQEAGSLGNVDFQ